MGLSYHWRTVLTKLSEYDDEGVLRSDFCGLMGDTDRVQPVNETLHQMFCRTKYVEDLKGYRIRITPEGRKALADE